MTRLWMLGLGFFVVVLAACAADQETTPHPTPTPAVGASPTPTVPVDPSPTADLTSTANLEATPEPEPPDVPPLGPAQVEEAFPGLPPGALGQRPVFLTYPPDGSDRLAVIAQEGLIFVFPNSHEATSASTFLDIVDQVSRAGNEEGLLGLAFHPRYAENGFFYVYYSAADPRRSVLSRFQVSDDPDRADPDTETVILEVPQPYSNHNGGMLDFGPDGYLYIALGDGGSAGDPQGNGQDPTTLLGSILRIDVDNPAEGLAYGIPPDNPFLEPDSPPDARPEIWAYGLRNPWRFSFDADTGELWVGDVGQDRMEEINLVRRGGNYGWNIMEGTLCFQPRTGCDPTGLEMPVFEYPLNPTCAITGGYIYRGAAVPWLQGAYVFGDYCSSQVWALRYQDGEVIDHAEISQLPAPLPSFGEDADGELYITAFDGRIYRLRDPS